MGVSDILARLASAGMSIRADGDRLVVAPAGRLTDDIREALREAKPELLTALADNSRRPYKLLAPDGDRAHRIAWDDATIHRFVTRRDRLLSLAYIEQDADDLAERLHLCDLLGDRRQRCVDCRHLSGTAPGGLQCRQAQRTAIGPTVSTDSAAKPRRCMAFGSVA